MNQVSFQLYAQNALSRWATMKSLILAAALNCSPTHIHLLRGLLCWAHSWDFLVFSCYLLWLCFVSFFSSSIARSWNSGLPYPMFLNKYFYNWICSFASYLQNISYCLQNFPLRFFQRHQHKMSFPQLMQVSS